MFLELKHKGGLKLKKRALISIIIDYLSFILQKQLSKTHIKPKSIILFKTYTIKTTSPPLLNTNDESDSNFIGATSCNAATRYCVFLASGQQQKMRTLALYTTFESSGGIGGDDEQS